MYWDHFPNNNLTVVDDTLVKIVKRCLWRGLTGLALEISPQRMFKNTCWASPSTYMFDGVFPRKWCEKGSWGGRGLSAIKVWQSWLFNLDELYMYLIRKFIASLFWLNQFWIISMTLRHFIGHVVKRTVEIGAVALWYQLVLEKIS